MHVLHIETGRRLYGGAQQVLYILAGLAARGIRNTLVCPPASGIAAAAAELDVEIVDAPMRGDLDVGAVRRLRRVLRDTAPDLVHCHSRRGADVYGGLAARFERVPAVVSRRVDNREAALLARLRYRPFRRVIAISAAIATVLRDTGIAEDKLCVIRSAVDVAPFEQTPSRERLAELFGIGAEHFAVACAGQLIPRKGQRFLLRAVAALRDRHPELRAVIFGEGRDESRLRSLVAELSLESSVAFAGFRPDLDTYLGAFDLLVHPATAEGLGVITLKAQAAGLPVVAFRAGGLEEAVVDGQTGTLVPVEDTRALAQAIATLADDSALRERYACQARAHARREFSIDTMVEKHIRLYRAVLGD